MKASLPLTMSAPHNLDLKGHLTPQWGGPAITFMKLALSENNDHTVLKLSDTTFGNVTENSRRQLEEG